MLNWWAQHPHLNNPAPRIEKWILALKNTLLLPDAVIRYVIIDYLLVTCLDDVCDFVGATSTKKSTLYFAKQKSMAWNVYTNDIIHLWNR